MESSSAPEIGEPPKTSPLYFDTDGIMNAIPRIQTVEDRSPLKPDNYRISPVSPQPKDDPTVAIPPLLDQRSDTITDLEHVLEDWSGRGAHVDFQPTEQLPLQEGRFLGQGSMGAVYETTVRGHAFAWKRRFCRHRIGDAERKEVDILKRVSHHHIIRLAGSYTHRHFLGFLLYPVASYDLATLLEDIEALLRESGQGVDELEPSQYRRLQVFRNTGGGYCSDPEDPYPLRILEMSEFLPPFLLRKIGCIITAVEYLHSQRIRHKDLKPSNILLSREGLWLTDFGTATDFSLQTLSMTENLERGTPKYFAPEMASYQPSGRAADIFSLGCVLLEIYTTTQSYLPGQLRNLRSAQDKSFQANLGAVQTWLYPRSWSPEATEDWVDEHFGIDFRREISRMLDCKPEKRPSISEVRTNFSLLDTMQRHRQGDMFLFDDCCKRLFLSPEEHNKKLLETTKAHDKEMHETKQAHQKEIDNVMAEHASRMDKLRVTLAAQAEEAKEELIRDHDLESARLRAIISEFQAARRSQPPPLGSNSTASISCSSCRRIFTGEYAKANIWRHMKFCHSGQSENSSPIQRHRIKDGLDLWEPSPSSSSDPGTPISESGYIGDVCKLCFRSVSTQEEMLQHFEYYHPTANPGDVSPLVANHASTVDEDSVIQEHLAQEHLVTGLTHRCDVCKWTTTSRRALQRHTDHMHPTTKGSVPLATSSKYMV